jgi:hypothetical protein
MTGEIWNEIDEDLSVEGIRPTTPDMQCIAFAKSMTTKKGQKVLQKQMEIIQRTKSLALKEELKFYDHFISVTRNQREIIQSKKNAKIRCPSRQRKIYRTKIETDL